MVAAAIVTMATQGRAERVRFAGLAKVDLEKLYEIISIILVYFV